MWVFKTESEQNILQFSDIQFMTFSKLCYFTNSKTLNMNLFYWFLAAAGIFLAENGYIYQHLDAKHSIFHF